MKLKMRLAEAGFESNEDYGFAIRCLLENTSSELRCLHIDGNLGRRKTAFAQALAIALEYPHRLYLDFTRPPPPPPEVLVKPEDLESASSHTPQKPLSALERVLSEACAFSESGRTVLILDQLQAADFDQQAQLAQFVRNAEFVNGSDPSVGSMQAHVRNFLLVLISEETLYHGLQKASFRIWCDPNPLGFDFKLEDFQLPANAGPLFRALAALFVELRIAPTHSELKRLLGDLEHRVRTTSQLQTALLGRLCELRSEWLERPSVQLQLEQITQELAQLLGVEEIQS